MTDNKSKPFAATLAKDASYTRHTPWIGAFDHLANRVTRWAGSPLGFAMAFFSVLVWSTLGPVFHYSENWQLVINTGTTIITFLMVFLIQQSQNKDSIAMHLKLNELLASSQAASNRLVGIEDLDEEALRKAANFYTRLAENVKAAGVCKETHSIDEDDVPADSSDSKVNATPSG